MKELIILYVISCEAYRTTGLAAHKRESIQILNRIDRILEEARNKRKKNRP